MLCNKSGYVQIIPADGWWAVYKEEDGTLTRSKVAAIAMHEDGGLAWLDPDSSGFASDATECSNFVGIYFDGDTALDKTKR